MYAETGIMFSYLQDFTQEVQHLEDFCRSQFPTSSVGSLVQGSAISDYDLGGEGDLFKAPEPIIEQPLASLVPMTAGMSIISCGEDIISSQALNAADIESFQNEQFLSEVFYECKKDMLEKEAMETPLSEVLNFQLPVTQTGENLTAAENSFSQGSFSKSVSSDCLSSMEWIQGAQIRPAFLEFGGMDFGAAYGMRRSFSEGDIKTLSNGDLSLVHSPQVTSNCTAEDRMQKLSRYRNKKTKRNFGRKIKYACRKALADSQPRIRGRFAKTEELDIFKK